MRRRSFNSESGVILPIVIILMLALIITGIAFLNAGVMEYNLVKREIHKNQAFWLAEAGVEHARVRLGENWGDWVTCSPLTSEEISAELEGTYSADIDNTETDGVTPLPSDRLRVRSEGTVEGLSKTVEVILVKPPSGGPIDSVLESGGGVNIRSAAVSIPEGEVVAATAIEDKHGVIPDGNEVPDDDRFADADQRFYEVFGRDRDAMRDLAIQDQQYFGQELFGNEHVEKVTWVDGDPDLSQITSDTWHGEGVLIINGNLKMTGGSFEGVIWVTGSFSLPRGNPVITGVVFVETAVDVSDTGETGIGGTVDLIYDPDVIQDAIGQIATLPWIESWREIP